MMMLLTRLSFAVKYSVEMAMDAWTGSVVSATRRSGGVCAFVDAGTMASSAATMVNIASRLVARGLRVWLTMSDPP